LSNLSDDYKGIYIFCKISKRMRIGMTAFSFFNRKLQFTIVPFLLRFRNECFRRDFNNLNVTINPRPVPFPSLYKMAPQAFLALLLRCPFPDLQR
ncbi:hypothetical protein PO124_30975, partial [Bacillus licheniformis]|nr:hypothetical protein [Bacillus licheniformis]